VVEQAVERMKDFRQIILVGTAAPVNFFAYPGRPSVPTSPDCEIYSLARPGEDLAGALAALADALGARRVEPRLYKPERGAAPGGAISLHGLAATVGALLPEGVIVVDESITSGRGMMAASRGAPPHDWLTNTGGSIGIGMPLAVGAAIASPGRPVLCLEADGSGMYTPQSLWTMAREQLDVTTVILANRRYRILDIEMARTGAGPVGPRAGRMLDLTQPEPDWVRLAQGLGVPAARAATADEFIREFRAAMHEPGPRLIEAVLPG